MRPRSIALRLVLGAALWIAAALAGGGFLIAGLFADHIDRSFDDRLAFLLKGLVAAAEINAAGEVVLIRLLGEPAFERPFSGWYWQIDDGHRVHLTSRSLWDQSLATNDDAGGQWRDDVSGPQGQRLRIHERAIILPGGAGPFRFAVAADNAIIDSALKPFVDTLSWSLAVLWIGLIGAVMVQVRYGLKPLRRIGQALAAIRTGQATRLEGQFPSEISPLADELNALIAQNEAVVERSRTHVGNLAHALKTPLTLLNNEAGRDGGKLGEVVRRQVDVMRRWVDHYLARARAAATRGVLGARTDVDAVVGDLTRTLRKLYRDRGLQFTWDSADGLAFQGDRQDLEEMLGNLMDNACKWAATSVHVGVAASDGMLQIRVDDDGPGMPTDQRQEALTRGKRLDETVMGSGLGLAIVADIAGLYAGGLDLQQAPAGGLRAVLTLPVAAAG